MKVVQAAIGSKANEGTLMGFCKKPREGQILLDLMQWVRSMFTVQQQMTDHFAL